MGFSRVGGNAVGRGAGASEEMVVDEVLGKGMVSAGFVPRFPGFESPLDT